MQVERDMFDLTRNGHILDGEHDLLADRLAIIRTVVVSGHLTADHQALEILLGNLACAHRINVHTVTQNRDGIGEPEHFLEVMGYEDDCPALAADALHHLVELLTAFLRQCCRRLVDNHDLRLEVCCLHDLNQLAVLKVVVIHHVAGLDAPEPVIVQQLLRLPVHRIRVLDAHVHEPVFMPEENVLGDRQAGKRSELLHDDRDTLVVGRDLVLRMDLLPVQDEVPAVDGIDARQHIGKGRLAGTIFTDQCVNFTLVDCK